MGCVVAAPSSRSRCSSTVNLDITSRAYWVGGGNPFLCADGTSYDVSPPEAIPITPFWVAGLLPFVLASGDHFCITTTEGDTSDECSVLAAPGAGCSTALDVGTSSCPTSISSPPVTVTLAWTLEDLLLSALSAGGNAVQVDFRIEDLLLSGGIETGEPVGGMYLNMSWRLEDLLFSGADLPGVVLSTSWTLDDLLFSGAQDDPGVTLSAAWTLESLLLGATTTIASGNPVADYQVSSNWDILRGCIDLAGSGPNGENDPTATDPVPGNGMYLDLAGSDPANSPGGDTTSAKIRSKQNFSFASGVQYRLTFYYAEYASFGTFMDVSIGDAGGVVAPTRFTGDDDSFNAFVLGTITWTQGSDDTGKIIFDYEFNEFAPYPTQGMLLDRIKLENLTSGEEMFYDDFDYENP